MSQEQQIVPGIAVSPSWQATVEATARSQFEASMGDGGWA